MGKKGGSTEPGGTKPKEGCTIQNPSDFRISPGGNLCERGGDDFCGNNGNFAGPFIQRIRPRKERGGGTHTREFFQGQQQRTELQTKDNEI